jgi:predicted esterase
MTNNFIYRFVPEKGDDAHPLLLPHGAGGNENDLLPSVGTMLSLHSELLSLRGPVP